MIRIQPPAMDLRFHRYILLSTLIALINAIGITPQISAEPLDTLKAAVVKIRAKTGNVGSGFIIRVESDKVFIITAAHVIAGDSQPEVAFFFDRNMPFKGTVLPGAEVNDDVRGLALVVVQGTEFLAKGIQSLTFGLSTDQVSGGENAFVIGHPGGGGDWAVVKRHISNRVGRDITFDPGVMARFSGGPILIQNKVMGIVMANRGGFGLGTTHKSVLDFMEGFGVFPNEPFSKKNPKAPHLPTDSTVPKTQEKDSNNSFQEAQEISYKTSVLGKIVNKTDKEFFRFTNSAPKRDWVKVALMNKSMTLSPLINIYGQMKNWLKSAHNSTPGGNLEIFFVAEPGEDYYIELAAYSKFGPTGKYSVVVEPQNLYDQYEPNDSSAQATPITTHEPLQGSVLDEKDLDWFQFESLMDQNILVSFKNSSKKLRPQIFVYDHLVQEILSKENRTPGGHIEFQFKPKTAGMYFLEVRGRYEYGKMKDEKYSLLLEVE